MRVSIDDRLGPRLVVELSSGVTMTYVHPTAYAKVLPSGALQVEMYLSEVAFYAPGAWVSAMYVDGGEGND